MVDVCVSACIYMCSMCRRVFGGLSAYMNVLCVSAWVSACMGVCIYMYVYIRMSV